MAKPRNYFKILPEDMIAVIEEYLPISDRSRFERTCRFIHESSYYLAPPEYVRRHSFFGFLSDMAPHPNIQTSDRKVKKLLKHVARGEKSQVKTMILQDPGILLEYSEIKDDSGRTLGGTALRIAFGSKDVSFGGNCDLIRVAPPANPHQTTFIYLLIGLAQIGNQYRLSKSVYVRFMNKLFYVDETNQRYHELRIDQETLQQFDKKLKPRVYPKTLSKKQLKTISRFTGHVHQDEMAEMIMHVLRTLPNGQQEIEKQIKEQFPDDWKEKERRKRKRDFDALMKVTEAIKQSQDKDNCDAAIEEFSQHLENQYKSKEVYKTGYYVSDFIYEYAIKLYSKNFFDFGGDNSYKNNLYWRKVIGKILRYVTGCIAQAICQHPSTLIEKGGKLRRSMQVRDAHYVDEDITFFPLDRDPRFIMGRDFAILAGPCDHHFRIPPERRQRMHEFFKNRDKSLKKYRKLTREKKEKLPLLKM